MNRRLLSSALCLSLLSAPVFLQAQTSSTEEERLEAIARSANEWNAPRNVMSVGFHVLSSGAAVSFRNLGTVPFNTVVPPLSDGAVARTYNDGAVAVDVARENEKDAAGNQSSTPGGRYQITKTVTTNVTDSSGNVTGTVDSTVVIGDYLSYTPGLTRAWSYNSAEQLALRPGYVGMNSYSTTSEGGALDKKQGTTGGVELQFARTLGKPTGRFEFSIVSGLAINTINSKTSGNVTAALHTQTDYYAVSGLTPPTESSGTPLYGAPSFVDLVDSSGNLVTTAGLETTTPLAAQPTNRTETTTPGATTVAGRWQIKGAYLMMRVGPSIRAHLTSRLGMTASLGVAGAYAGTQYSAAEAFAAPNGGEQITTEETSNANKFLAGYYADFNVEWAANDTTGLFTGISAQKFGDYAQSLASRSARVDLGSSIGLRGGISIRF